MITLEEGGRFVAPYNAPYADQLRDTPGWYGYDGVCWWTEDVERVVPFIEHLDPEIAAIILETAANYEASKADTTDLQVDTPEGMTLEDFQRVDVEFILNHLDTLLAEECGTGKTPIMIVALNMLKVKRALIICPAVAKYNWSDNEWPMWSTLKHLSVGVVEGDVWPDTDVVIINYDILFRHKKMIDSVHWDCLLVDEAHRANGEESRRAVMILGGNLKIVANKKQKATEIAESYNALPAGKRSHYTVPAIPAKKRVFATGTPFNRPKNLWNIVRAIDPDDLGRNQEEFWRRYCGGFMDSFGWNVSGATHQEELGVRLRKFMARHDAEKVLNLPFQDRKFFVLPPVDVITSEENDFLKRNMETLMGLGDQMGVKLDETSTKEEFMKVLGEAVFENTLKLSGPQYQVLFTEFSALRKATGIAKVPHIIDYVKMRSDDGTIPVCVYAYHREVMFALKEAFPDCAFVVGGMSSKARTTEVRRFQDGEVNYFLGNMDAAGENITLTRSRNMVIGEMDWRGTQLKQVFMRLRRYTQKHPSVVDILCAARSFDQPMATTAFNKIKNIDLTLDS